MPPPSSNVPSSDRSAETRARILDAALSEFAANGLAGARTERIASAAGVNKALIYYYFDSKEKLYAAALEMIAVRIRDNSMKVFFREATPGERILRAALGHFDRILSQPEFQSLMQQEMIRVHQGEPALMEVLTKRVFEPVQIMFRAAIREGIESGELIEADWMQMQLSMLGANVFYFLSAPVWKMVHGEDPLAPDALALRRKAMMDFLGQAIFKDRQHGAALARKVFADVPMPDLDRNSRKVGRSE